MADSPVVNAENYLAPETLAQLAPFEMRAKMIVEGVMSGMHRSPYQGMAVEFAEHRQYVAGDDPKHLDWKVYGRSDKLYIKQYQQETNLDVVLLIDASASMGYGSLAVKPRWGGTTASRELNRWTKFDHATALATAVAYLCLQQQDRVGVVVFADEVRSLIKRSSAKGQWRRIVSALGTEPVEASTDLAKVSDQVLSKISNRALFIIISDLFTDRDAIRQALARFRHRRHDVILLNTLDRQELRFEFTQAAPFKGLEDEGKLNVDPRALRQAYLESLSDHLDHVARTTRGFGYDYQRLDTHESVGPPLAYLLARRSAILKRSKAGMTFVTAGLAVAGVASILIPILIFLLWRQRRTPIQWGAMRFLIEAYRKHRRRLRFEQIILLAVRCLILALLGMALARPLLESAGLLDAGGARLVYLVIDDGLASGAQPADGASSLKQHVERAIEIVDSLDPGDRVGVITTSRPARILLSPPSTDHGGVKDLLESLRPTLAPSDLPGALDRLGAALSGADEEMDQAFAYLLSDFRAGSTTLEDTLPETLGQIGSRIVLRAAPPASTPLANVQVTAIEPARRLHVAGAIDGSGQVTVRLARQGGELGREVTTVRLRGDDLAETPPKIVEWTPGQSTASAKFFLELPVQRDGEIGLSAAIDADAVVADNVQHTVLALRKAIRVVLIDRRSFGYEPSLERLTAGQWLRRALAPAMEGPVEVIEVEPAALDDADLRAADVVILPRPDLLTDEGWRALRVFVDQNGLLLVSPPAERTVHQWTDRLATDLDLPWQIERETVTLTESMPLALEQPPSRLLRMISSDLSELCRPVLVERLLPIDPTQTQATTILELNDGSPFLIMGSPRVESATTAAPAEGDEREAPPIDAAGGLVVYMAAAPQLDWTNMPSKPLMVPLTHEILRQGVSLIRGRAPVGVGTRPTLVVGRAAAGLTTPTGDRLALDATSRPERRFTEAGLYKVTDLAAQPIGTLAVNVDPASGRTDLQPASAVKSWLARSGPWEWFDTDDVAAELVRADSGSPLAGFLLVLVLALLVLETILARLFSHAYQSRQGDAAGGLRSTMQERPLHDRAERKRGISLGLGGGA